MRWLCNPQPCRAGVERHNRDDADADTGHATSRADTRADWLDAYLAIPVTWCGPQEQIPLGGTQATIGLNGCSGLGRLGGRVYDVVLLKGERAYNFTMEGAVDRALLLAMLATVTFDPKSAVD